LLQFSSCVEPIRTNMGYSEKQIETMEIVNYTCASISVVGSLFIIVSFMAFRSLRTNFAYGLVFLLAIADLIRSVGKIWGSFLSADPLVRTQCSVAGVVNNFGALSSIVFVAVICSVMYLAVQMEYAHVWSVSQDIYRRRQCVIALIVWSVTFAISCLPLMHSDGYGYVGAWCWITSNHHEWRWLCFYGPLITIWTFCIVMYSVIAYQLRKVQQAVPKENRKQYALYAKLKWYPMVLLIAFLFPTIRRIYQMFDDEAPFALGILHTLGAGLYGVLNAIVYGVNAVLKREIKKSLEGTIATHEMRVVETIPIKSRSSTQQ